MLDSLLETPRCTRRYLPVLEPSSVSVTFRRLLPNEFVVRYVLRHIARMKRPLRCSVNVVIERHDDVYYVALRGPTCSRMGLSAVASSVVEALRNALVKLEHSGACPLPVLMPDTGA